MFYGDNLDTEYNKHFIREVWLCKTIDSLLSFTLVYGKIDEIHFVGQMRKKIGNFKLWMSLKIWMVYKIGYRRGMSTCFRKYQYLNKWVSSCQLSMKKIQGGEKKKI